MTIAPQMHEHERLYTGRFFHVAAAVLLFMSGVALQFHFGQYIAFRGFGVDTLGRILGISMVGTLLVRLKIGRWIDRFGCKPTWLVAATLVALSMATIQFTSQFWLIVMLRGVWAMSMAAVMTTVAVFAAQIAPPGRRAESIGSMGMAGFIGMIIGPTVGDLIFAGDVGAITPYRIFFFASAACSLGSAVVMSMLKAPAAGVAVAQVPKLGVDNVHSVPQRRGAFPQLRIIIKHWPGTVLLTGAVFSMVFCLQSTFLERLAEERGFRDIKLFFLLYSPTAMLLRVVFRRLPQTIGRSRTLVSGSVLFITGLACLVGVDSQLGLVLPGILMGAGHCFIFPSMVDLAAHEFPSEHRGTGTAVILGAGDVGMVTGFLLLGEVIDAFGFDSAIYTLVGLLVFGTVVFSIARRGVVFSIPRSAA